MNQEIEQIEIINRIKKIRKENHLTQEYLANKIQISLRAYAKIESGETQLTINRIIQIAEILNVSPCKLLGFVNNTYTNENNTVNALQASDKIINNYEEIIKVLKEQNKMLREMVKVKKKNV